MFSFELVYFASHAVARLRLKNFENPGTLFADARLSGGDE